MQSENSADVPSIDTIMGYEDEELFAILGQWVFGDSLGVRPRDLAQLVRMGRDWFDEHADKLRDLVCHAPVVVAARAEASVAAMIDAATLADLIASHFGRLPASVAAVIIVRRGLDWLCRE